MAKQVRWRSARRIAVVSVAVVAIITGTGVLSTWRYRVALSESAVAIDELGGARNTALLRNTFWKERTAIDGYFFFTRTHAQLLAVTAERAQFLRLTAALGQSDTAVQRRAKAEAVAAQAGYYSLFTQLLAKTGGLSGSAVGRLQIAAEAVLRPLNALDDDHQVHAVAATAKAAPPPRQAIATGVTAVLLAMIAGGAGTLLAYRMLSGAYRREDDLTTAMKRLGNRDELLARLRSTSAVLAEVAGELRLAMKNAAAVTSEQSSAVAETSATIEELASTAGLIADNAHAVGKVSERAGDTMRDMQEKVEAIAARALSLGERAQKIGEILELINDIAGQTNMLALNAAIEAARAGEAGKGFAVVATEVRKLAERSVHSTDSISVIIRAVQDETNATIMATEQGTRQAREVGELMASTATMLEESILATQQQKSAADQVDGAIQQIRESADQLAAEQTQWGTAAEWLESLVDELESTLREDAGEPSP
jgi:hypothetical protein